MGLLRSIKDIGSAAVNIGTLGAVTMGKNDPIKGLLGSGIGIGGHADDQAAPPPMPDLKQFIAASPAALAPLAKAATDQGLQPLNDQKQLTPKTTLADVAPQKRDLISQAQRMSAPGGGQNSALFEALGARASKGLDATSANLNRERGLTALDDASRRLDMSRSVQSADREFEIGVRRKQLDYQMSQWAAELQQRSARNAFLGSILGAAGTVGGALVAGPAGAAVGGGVGNAMGPKPIQAQPPQYSTGVQPYNSNAFNNAYNTPTYTSGMRF